jgi:hypothetical protein
MGAHAVWDLASDFQIDTKASNPNPGALGDRIWYFMESASLARDPSTYRLLGEFITDRFGVQGLESWQGTVGSDAKNKLPSVSKNTTNEQKFFEGITWPARSVLVHPLFSRLVVVGWRSPKTGFVEIAGSVTDRDSSCGDGFGWEVSHGTETLASGDVPNGGAKVFRDANSQSLEAVKVKKGEFVYFIVDPGPTYDCDSTELTATITL